MGCMVIGWILLSAVLILGLFVLYYLYFLYLALFPLLPVTGFLAVVDRFISIHFQFILATFVFKYK
jgi:hypothetical protein